MQTSQEPTAGSASAKLVPIMEAVLGENAAREHVQEIAACEVKARLENCWADRRNWSHIVRWREEAVHAMRRIRQDSRLPG